MTTRVPRSRKEFSKTLGRTNSGKMAKKRCRRTTRSKELQPAPSTDLVQRLYETCNDVFKSGGVADVHPSDVQTIRAILDGMVPQDAAIHPEMIRLFHPDTPVASQGAPRIGYTGIHQCKNFTICIFFLEPDAVIPLHNHPGMTVFSKLLTGTIHVKAYDWADQAESEDSSAPPSKLRLAKLKANDIISAPCDTSVLYPTSGGNIHEFRAITHCAFLDVISPPYSKEEGRDSTYYKDMPYSALPISGKGSLINKEEAKSYGWLEEIKMAPIKLYGVPYMGPKLIETTP